MARMKKPRKIPFTTLTQAAVAQQQARAEAVWNALSFDFTIHGRRWVREIYAPTFTVEDTNSGDVTEHEVDASEDMMQLIRQICRMNGSSEFIVEA